MAVKMILFDLDGTLLTSEKTVSAYTMQILSRAAEKGILIVPSTGRLYSTIPEQLRNLPGVRYTIAINGALVYDKVDKTAIYTAEVPAQRAIQVYEYLDTLPVIYDCFQDNVRYMSRSNEPLLEKYIPNRHILKMVWDSKVSVEDLKTHLRESGRSLQKLQAYFLTQQLRRDTTAEMEKLFPDLILTSSLLFNVEINDAHATKGEAMENLCRHLGISPQEVLACGDGSNDITMIRRAGIGVAMGNAEEEVKACADYITDTNDCDGVAKAIEKFCDL